MINVCVSVQALPASWSWSIAVAAVISLIILIVFVRKEIPQESVRTKPAESARQPSVQAALSEAEQPAADQDELDEWIILAVAAGYEQAIKGELK